MAVDALDGEGDLLAEAFNGGVHRPLCLPVETSEVDVLAQDVQAVGVECHLRMGKPFVVLGPLPDAGWRDKARSGFGRRQAR